MSQLTTSTLVTSIELTASSYTATLAALNTAQMLSTPKQAAKFGRAAAAILAHRAPQGEEVVRVQMNLRRLNIVRMALRAVVPVAIESSSTCGIDMVAKLAQVDATVARRAAELN